MKVTRLRRGYRIRLTDVEYDMLSAMIAEAESGEADYFMDDDPSAKERQAFENVVRPDFEDRRGQ